MAEFNQFTISDTAFDAATQFVEDGWFDTVSEAGIFAASYTIRKHFDDVDLSTLYYAHSSHNFSYNTFDPDGSRENIIRNLYGTDTPRAFYRNLIIWGLEDMGRQYSENGMLRITDFI